MNNKIVEAIKHQKIVMFSYKGKDRIVEPHTYGTHNHQEILKGYQTGGKSDNTVPGWDLFHVSEIKDFKLTEGTFEKPRPDYTKSDKAFERVFCEV